MTPEERWERYLYETHPPDELRAWARSLEYFRFCRAYGGHSNDGDQLLVALAIESERGLREVCAPLGVPLAAMSGAGVTVGASYTGAEWARLAFPFPDFPAIALPGWVVIDGVRAYVGAGPGRLTISVADETQRYDVTAAAVESAGRIERLLVPMATRVLDPPQNDRNCVSPQQHPQLWR